MTEMTVDQEMRAKALEISGNFVSNMVIASMIAKKPIAFNIFENVDDLYKYIKTGDKPKKGDSYA